MIGHEAIADQAQLRRTAVLGPKAQIDQAFGIVEENVPAVVPTLCDVMGRSTATTRASPAIWLGPWQAFLSN